ncbi:zinc metalloproteinase nas-4-like [Rhopilema esculentum]|uniref:zinc metalloproteinase nas-4-like n=1 Tax=Rhopilema esculentum TaxID=499914 RepID=UPI0031E01AB4
MKLALLLALAFTAVFAQKADEMNPFDKIMFINNNAGAKFSVDNENNHPDLFEGDIVMTKSLQTDIDNMEYAAKNKISKFDAITNGAWSNGVIPYTFDRNFNARGRSVVRQAIADYQKYTCIKWVPRTNQRSYVTFFHGSGCYSMIGQQGGPQRISMASPGCLSKGIAIHEMMHCAGFFHEQSRTDRDRYIKIQWGNIMSGVDYNFKKYRYGQASTLGEPYDKQSVMHYGNYAFSKNRGKTIVSLSNPSETLGQRRGFSRIDINQLNKYYKCRGTKPQPTKKPVSTCTDSYVFCKALKSYCSHSWVIANCKKSCNRCSRPKPRPKPKPNCEDQNRYCPGWARAKYCNHQRYKSFMQRSCKKSCNFC